MKKTILLMLIMIAAASVSSYAAEIVFDNFEDSDTGEPYPDWVKILAKYEVPTHTVEAGGADGTAKAYQLIDDSAAGQWFGKYFDDDATGVLYFDVFIKNVEATTSLWIALRKDEAYGFYIEFDEAAGTPVNFGSVAGGKEVVMDTYEADKWYHVQVQYDTKGKASLWIDDDKVLNNVTCDELDSVNNVSFGTGGGFMGTLWIDEVYVGTTPKPAAVDARDKLAATWGSIKGDLEF